MVAPNINPARNGNRLANIFVQLPNKRSFFHVYKITYLKSKSRPSVDATAFRIGATQKSKEATTQAWTLDPQSGIHRMTARVQSPLINGDIGLAHHRASC